MMAVVPVVVGGVGIVVFLVLLANLLSRSERSRQMAAGFDAEWFDEFSAFRYLPMRRLLNGTDEAYVQQKRMGDSSTLRQFRAERRMLFRMYMQDLKSDFGRLTMGAKLAFLMAAEDHSDQVAALAKLEWQFRVALLGARCQLFVHACGFQPADASGLINALQHFEFRLREVYLVQGEQAG